MREQVAGMQTDWRIGVLRDTGLIVIWPRKWWLAVVVGLGVTMLLCVGSLWLREFVFFTLAVVFWGLGQYLDDKGNEVTAAVLSFHLPHYRRSLRVRHFVEGGLIGLGLALWLYSYALMQGEIRDVVADARTESPISQGPQAWVIALAMTSVFVGGMGIHVAARALGYTRSRWSAGVGLMSILLYVLVIWGPSWAGKHPTLAWSWLLPLGLALGVFSWIRLGDMRHIRQGHRMLIQDRLVPRAEIKAKERPTVWRVDALFRRRMERHAYLSGGRYYWDELYRLLGPLLCRWRTVLFWLAIAALVLGLFGEPVAGLGFVLFGLVAVTMHLPLAPDHVLLLPVGRRERSAATALIAAGISTVHAVFGAVVIALFWLAGLVAGILPLERLGSMAFLKIDPAWFYWPCLLVPWAIASRLLRGRARRIVQGGLVIVTVLLVAGVCLHYLDMIPAWRIHAVYVCVLAGGWLLLLAILRTGYRAGDLI